MPDLKLKAQPKQLLGYLLLAFALPDSAQKAFCRPMANVIKLFTGVSYDFS
jgi:hypothetical protein